VQAYGNLVYANGTYGFPYGVLEQNNTGLEARDLYFAVQEDGEWTTHPAVENRPGNVLNIFATTAAGPDGAFHLV